MKIDNNPIFLYFKSQLTLKNRPDGNFSPVVSKGDCSIMLSLMRMKIDKPHEAIDRADPGKFRGKKLLEEDMRRVLGQLKRFHILKWGVSAVRGGLRSGDQKGNKKHIVALIDLLNEYTDGAGLLQDIYDACIRIHHDFWESLSLSVTFQELDTTQERLFKLINVASFGRVQQGIVYSFLRLRYGPDAIKTKGTFAGDDQSSRTGRSMKGDIQVYLGGALGIALEIKDAVVDAKSWQRVEETHGEHEYALFVLASDFRPKNMQFQISAFYQTFGLHLFDFLLTLIFLASLEENVSPNDLLLRVIDIYNDEFCEDIEKNTSIKIDLKIE